MRLRPDPRLRSRFILRQNGLIPPPKIAVTIAATREYNVIMNDGAIGIFDSGVGGLKILQAAVKRLTTEDFIYVFDRSHAPYGNRSDRYVRRRAEKVSKLLIERGAKIVVAACNTATGVGIRDLREKFNVPFVGVEPPVKPAALARTHGKILVLTTCRTAEQANFLALMNEWNDGNIIVAPQVSLARDVEANFASLPSLKPEIDRILAPYDGEDIESVVLGCTHYYYVAGLIAAHYGGSVRIFDTIGGVVNRLDSLLDFHALRSSVGKGRIKYIYL